jgi:hypothetical protein
MPKRVLALLALVLAVLVCLVLVMPQVDLDDGVLNCQSQALLLLSASLACGLITFLPANFFHALREFAFGVAPRESLFASSRSILRC